MKDLEHIPQDSPQPVAEKRHTVLRLNGLDCADCAAKLAAAVRRINGVHRAEINFGTSRLVVDHSVPLDVIVKTINNAGYEVRDENPAESPASPNRRTISTFVSGLALGVGFALSVFTTSDFPATLMFLIAIFSGGALIARGAYQAVRALSLDMNVLMVLAVTGAVVIGEWAEGATVVFLFAVGNTLQAHTLEKTRRSLQTLMDLSPKEAFIRRTGRMVRLPVDSIRVGDTMIIKPGERIAMDGLVSSGRSSVNQAAITGESLPQTKQRGDKVFAGTLNEEGLLEVRVTRLADDTTLARIIHMVEEAEAQKSPAQQFVDGFARYYTPAVIAAAALIAVLPPLLMGLEFSTWFYRALVLLVIACPCALVISTPVAIVAAIGNAARHGVLIKGGVQLEALARIKAVVLDKTGTVTTGKPSVTDVITTGCFTPAEVLRAAAAVEAFSQHPLAQAITRHAEEQGIRWPEAQDFTSFTGEGAEAVIGDRCYRIGSPGLFNRLGVSLQTVSAPLDRLQRDGKTVVILASDNGIQGLIAIADRARPGSRSALSALTREGIEELILLTGDNRTTAQAMAAELGIERFEAELLPGQKLAAVQKLKRQFGNVAMVGEGVNDAPALAAADVGIAMGAAGTDTALETADIALMHDDLTKLPFTLRLSRRTLRIIKENVVFALTVKALFILLTVAGLSTLWMAVFADTGAALLVIANSMRLVGTGDPKRRKLSEDLSRAA